MDSIINNQNIIASPNDAKRNYNMSILSESEIKKLWRFLVSIFITEKCNVNCHYYDIPNIKEPKEPKELSYDNIKSHSYIFKICNMFNLPICLTGGEPSTLNNNILEYLISNINTKLYIATNGLF